MASTSTAALLLLSAGLFTGALGFGDDCKSYYSSGSHAYRPAESCGLWLHCCGTCDHRYCCSSEHVRISEHDQNLCNIRNSGVAVIVSGVVGIVVTCVVFVVCCCCPCCCIYKMCKKPRPVVSTHVTTVTNTQCIRPQPVLQGAQYPSYHPVPTHPAYAQPYAAGPPPPYHVAASPGYPSGQPAYGGSKAVYPMLPPAQPGVAHLPPETFEQPAYNPAYMPTSAY